MFAPRGIAGAWSDLLNLALTRRTPNAPATAKRDAPAGGGKTMTVTVTEEN
jgi:hypothetical protein